MGQFQANQITSAEHGLWGKFILPPWNKIDKYAGANFKADGQQA